MDFLILKRYCTVGCLYMYHHLCLLFSWDLIFGFLLFFSLDQDEFCTFMQLEYAEKEDSYLRSKEVRKNTGIFFLQNQGRSQKKLMTEAISPWLSSLPRYLLVRVFMMTIKQQKWTKWLRPQLACYWLFKGQKIMRGINSWNLLVF